MARGASSTVTCSTRALAQTLTSSPPRPPRAQVEKLYGHAFELVAVASAHSSPLIATACKATAPEHAVVRLYSTDSWQPVGTVLDGHSLTITKLVFSPASKGDKSDADKWLLSVSRDRSWRLYERSEGEGQGACSFSHSFSLSQAGSSSHLADARHATGTYQPCASAKSHARIIWDAAWASDASFFATASRDKTVRRSRHRLLRPSPLFLLLTRDTLQVRVWAQEGSGWASAATLKFDEAATSVAASFDEDKRCVAHLFRLPSSRRSELF